MKEFIVRNKTFFKHLSSYLLILCIPLAIMSFLIFKQIVTEIERHVISANLQMLGQVRNTIDRNMLSFEKTAVHISKNPKLTPYQIARSEYSQYETYLELKEYLVNNDLIFQLFLYINDREDIYSSSGRYSLKNFLTRNFTFETSKEEQLLKLLQSPESRTVLPIQDVSIGGLRGNKNFIIFAYPLPPDQSYVYGSVLFFIDESTIQTMINDILKDFGGVTVIMDQNGEVITSSTGVDEDYIRSLSSLEILHRGSMNNTANITHDNKNYIANVVHSDSNGWSYVTLVPKEEYLKEVQHIKHTIYNGIMIAIAIGLLAAVFIVLVNTIPIRRLRNSLEVEGIVSSSKDDLTVIHHAVHHIAQTNRELLDQIEQHKQYVKSHLLMMLLRGQIVDQSELALFLKESNLRFSLPHFLVVILSVESSHVRLDHSSIPTTDFNVSGELAFHVVEGFDDLKVAYIINISSNLESPKSIDPLLMSMKQRIEHASGMECSIGVGNLYDDWRLISKSMIEASSALDYRLLKGEGTIIYYSDIVELSPMNTWQPYEKLHRMSVSMKSGDMEQTEQLLTEVIESLVKQNIPLYIARCYCFEIINILMKVLHELNIQWDQLPGHKPDVMTLTQFETVGQLKTSVHEICTNICQYIRKRMEGRSRNLAEELKQYIHSNYKDSSFNFSKMSEYFEMSSPYLSRYFKEQTGMTMIDYLTELRMNEVCRQLEHSDKLIKDIIREAGYFDIASFNKKFKKKFGFSPGLYRQLKNEVTKTSSEDSRG